MSRALFCIVMLCCVALAAPSAATQDQLHLTAAQAKQLKAMSLTLVVPSWVPSGFVRRPIQIDSKNKRYSIAYVASDGSSLFFEGNASPQTSQVAHVSHHRGFFERVSSSVGKLFNHPAKANTTSTNLSGEEEADPSQMDVVADSRLIGPAHFKPDSQGCSAGQSQNGIAPAKYTLTGCKVNADQLIHVYRSATKIALH